MRLYTACADGCRVLTINATSPEEALDTLTTLLGDTDGMVVRVATADEAMAWNASAMEAEGDTIRRNTLADRRDSLGNRPA